MTGRVPTDQARLIEVIETTLMRRGSGSVDNPVRMVRQYWTTDGEMLAEVDEFAPTHCNAVGHKIYNGDAVCIRCSATLEQIAKAAGKAVAS